MFIEYNPNPRQSIVGDCTVRAIAKLMDTDWDTAYTGLMAEGFKLKDMPSANEVWASYLREQGYKRHTLPNTCPDCYTVTEFCKDNPKGKYLLATGTHVVTVVDGNHYDTWDSGSETPIYYFAKETD